MWNLLDSSACLLFAEGRVAVMAQGFEAHEAEGGQSTLILVSACLTALVVAVAIHIYVRRRLRAAVVEPWSLFGELCSANKLSPRQRLLMRSMAKAKGLTDPCRLFLDARLWLVEPASEPQLCRPGKNRQIRRLQKLLFQAPAAETTPQT